MNTPTTLLIFGGGGRMGTAILQETAEHADLKTVGALVEKNPETELATGPPLFTRVADALAAGPGAVILEFTNAGAALVHLEAAARSGNPIVLGTTGLGEAGEQVVEETALRIPVVVAPNTSTGIAILAGAMEALPDGTALGWDTSLLDHHHRGKLDAPSGTARVLSAILEARGWKPEVTSLREGDVVGEHTIRMVGDHEELVFTHRAFSRKVFAQGALLAARFAATASPGRYTMRDVLGLNKD